MTKFVKRILAAFALLTVEIILVWALIMLSFGVFFYITKLVFVEGRTGLDEAAFAFAESHSSPGFARFMETITYLASFPFLLVASLSVSAYYLFIRKHRWYSIKIAVMAMGGTLLNQGLKFFFERPRPTTVVDNFSFPSGHTMIGLTFYGVLIYLAWQHFRNPVLRLLVCGSLLALVLIIGYSRVFLRMHYATDVIAGLAGGLVWLIAGIYMLRRIERYTRKEIAPVVEEKAFPDPPPADEL